MTDDLTRTLRLEEKYLKYDDMRALDYCEKRWQQEGCPTERWPMVNFIERMLKELQANGIGYPKALLLRKKQIQRQEFIPTSNDAQEPKEAQTCPLCCGTGWQNGSLGYKPCSCDLGKPHRDQLAKWGMKI